MNAIVSPWVATAWPVQQVRRDPIAEGQGVPVALWLGFCMCTLSLISALVLAFVIGCEPPTCEVLDVRDPTPHCIAPGM